MDFSHPTYLQIFLTASLPIMGLAYALVGGLKLSLVDRLQIDEGKVGRLVGGFGTMFGPTAATVYSSGVHAVPPAARRLCGGGHNL